MLNIGPFELIVIFIIALLVLGPKKLPELACALGKAVGEFKKAMDELKNTFKIDLKSSFELNKFHHHTIPQIQPENKNQESKKEKPAPMEEKK